MYWCSTCIATPALVIFWCTAPSSCSNNLMERAYAIRYCHFTKTWLAKSSLVYQHSPFTHVSEITLSCQRARVINLISFLSWHTLLLSYIVLGAKNKLAVFFLKIKIVLCDAAVFRNLFLAWRHSTKKDSRATNSFWEMRFGFFGIVNFLIKRNSLYLSLINQICGNFSALIKTVKFKPTKLPFPSSNLKVTNYKEENCSKFKGLKYISLNLISFHCRTFIYISKSVKSLYSWAPFLF